MDFSQIGNIIVGSIPAVAAVGFFLHRIERRFNFLMIEHEILVKDYCDRNNIEVHDLPTRVRGIR